MSAPPFLSAGALLGISDGNAGAPVVAAVVGCGGKTTFISALAREYRQKKVLITPTTKILPMRDQDVVVRTTLADCEKHSPVTGIQCLGIQNSVTGKLEALPSELLARIAPQYDLILLEADGSRGLPCKGWRDDEPVVPGFCTHTVGIVTMDAIGKPADDRSVLRLPEFLALTGLHEGEPITPKTLSAMVCAPGGMFKNSAGMAYLFVNRVEDEKTATLAGEWLRNIQTRHPGRFRGLAYGSAQSNQWQEAGTEC